MGKPLVSESDFLVPVLINFEGLGASPNTREGSREDVHFPLLPFKDIFIKSLCFHSGLNMGRLNGKVIISPRLLMERGDQGKREPPARGKKRPLPQIGMAHTCTCLKHTQPCSHTTSVPTYPSMLTHPACPPSRPLVNIPQYLQILLHLLRTQRSELPVSCHTLTLLVCILILCLSLLLPVSSCAAKPIE